MGMIACYMSLTDEIADQIAGLGTLEEVIEQIEDLSVRDLCPLYEMDKLWDGLHYLLTGNPASEPIENHPLSEAIVGVHDLFAEDGGFISAIGCDELGKIITELKQVDRQALKNQFSIASFQKAKIYPNIWEESKREELATELLRELEGLLRFYEESEQAHRDVLISIY
ncbi:YfbM family protein [Brevibacillus reuszeri]|uniref:DUF1877 domain-containing protein n=2 Tax=Brevibacillus reuszeri TaxID=54915 RepID=A0A0K9YM91_9BACL|nr:YfbM family protein [Brevibacillus reuszeri]KNB69315.1 hypothetical protein ADS79_25760 [Brevibacillus reuszeri]MED1860388.1 YfbM family protein [Brevibacillus reuszeri]